jgi:hypothetical protein
VWVGEAKMDEMKNPRTTKKEEEEARHDRRQSTIQTYNEDNQSQQFSV